MNKERHTEGQKESKEERTNKQKKERQTEGKKGRSAKTTQKTNEPATYQASKPTAKPANKQTSRQQHKEPTACRQDHTAQVVTNRTKQNIGNHDIIRRKTVAKYAHIMHASRCRPRWNKQRHLEQRFTQSPTEGLPRSTETSQTKARRRQTENNKAPRKQ